MIRPPFLRPLRWQIMGPSGAGKTTLCGALAAQLPVSPGATLEGVVTVNGRPWDETVHCAFVKQDDEFFSQMTVRETIDLAARLRLHRSVPEATKAALVQQLIGKLGLAKCAETAVGSSSSRGISGGERKRLSIALELLTAPGLLILDEPTSGLDAFAAESVVASLKRLAVTDGTTIVLTIHQPRASIYNMIDDLVLLADGRVVYAGPASQAAAYFGRLGFPSPPGCSVAEFVVDLVSVDHSSPEAEAGSHARLAQLAGAWAAAVRGTSSSGPGSKAVLSQYLEASSSPGSSKAGSRPRAGPLDQFRLLFGRAWRQVTRDKATTLVRATTALSSALIFGSLFNRLGLSQPAIQSRLGLLQVAVINTAMSSLIKTLQAFPRERAIVESERGKKAYAVFPYLTAKLLAELPTGASFPLLFCSLLYPTAGLNGAPKRFARFLGITTLTSLVAGSMGLTIGAAAPNAEAAVAIGPSLMVVFIILGGFYSSASTVPKALRWLAHGSLIKQGFEGLCVNDLQGLRFETTGRPGEAATGEQVLARLGYAETQLGAPVAALSKLLLLNYVLTFAILKLKKPTFMQMTVPPSRAAAAGV